MSAYTILREPLLHFVLLGTAVFGLWEIFSTEGDQYTIPVPQGDIQEYTETFEQRHQRTPDNRELSTYKSRWLNEEILFREGLALGLVNNDPVIRERVIRKMQLVLTDSNTLVEPSRAELQKFLAENKENYQLPARFSFQVVSLSNESIPQDIDAERYRAMVQEALNNGAEAGQVGERHKRYDNTSAAAIHGLFGASFLNHLDTLNADALWQILPSKQGPVLTRMGVKQAAELPDFDEIEHRLRADWRKAQSVKAVEQGVARLAQNYKVEWADMP